MFHTRCLVPVLFLVGFALAGCGGGGAEPDPGGPAAQINVYELTPPDVVLFGFELQGVGVDPEGGTLAYAWDFDGDGTVDDTSQYPTAYLLSGHHRVRLTVTNERGASSVAEVTLAGNPRRDEKPVAALRAFALTGAVGTEFWFHAPADVFDPSRFTPGRWHWDFQNDGTVDLITEEPYASTTYGAPGTYACRVFVSDPIGKFGDAQVTVVVCDEGTVSQSPPVGQIRSQTGQWSTFTHAVPSSASQILLAHGVDPDGGPITVEWDLDGDGRFDDATGSEAVLAAPHADVRRVSVRMTDDEGARSHARACFRTGSLSEPGAPGIVIRSDLLTAAVGQSVRFWASWSDDELLGGEYAMSWDFDGDGVEDAGGLEEIATRPWEHAYDTPGVYMPQVTLTDADGNVTRSYLTLVVLACQPEGAGPYPTFELPCDDIELFHGGGASPIFAPTVPVGLSVPTLHAGTVRVEGTGGLDEYASELAVRDHDGVVFMAPGMPVRPAGTAVRLDVASTHVDGPARRVPYTVTLRVEHPGVWVRILQCRVAVTHLGEIDDNP